MPARYTVKQAANGDWQVIDGLLAAAHPQKILSAHSQKEAAEATVAYHNENPIPLDILNKVVK